MELLIGAYSTLEAELRQTTQSELYQSLFGIGGTSQAITDHLANLKRRRKEGDPLAHSPKAKEAIDKFDQVTKSEKSQSSDVQTSAAAQGLGGLQGTPPEELVSAFVDWNGTWTTVAFQAALVATFFETVERVNRKLSNAGEELLDLDVELQSYIDSINSFLVPETIGGLSDLVTAIRGATGGDTLETVLGPAGPASLRSVLTFSELQPDAWPRIRFMLLECWNSDTTSVQDEIVGSRAALRGKAFSNLYRKGLNDAARQSASAPEDLDDDTKAAVFNDAFSNLQTFVKALSDATLSPEDMKDAMTDQGSEDEEESSPESE